MKIPIFYTFFVVSTLIAFSCKNTEPKTTTTTEKSAETAPTNDDQKSVILSAVKILVEKEMTIPVSLQETYFNSEGNNAFITAAMQKPDGSKMDFSKTPFKMQDENGVFSEDVLALLKNENGAWKVKAIAVGATDVPSVCWHKEYKVSKTLFPKNMTSDDCIESDPFIFIENSGRMTLNGGIGLDLEELKVELVEALSRMDKMPKTITPEFEDKTGGKIGSGMRNEIKSTIAEAIEAAKSKKK